MSLDKAHKEDDMEYRILEEGEVIQIGDEVDMCNDGWTDDPVWMPTTRIGELVPDPQYPSHRLYRRKQKVKPKERCDD